MLVLIVPLIIACLMFGSKYYRQYKRLGGKYLLVASRTLFLMALLLVALSIYFIFFFRFTF